MKYSASEKMETIRVVEGSSQGVKATLKELGISRSTFYDWYDRYAREGYEGLKNQVKTPKQFWNAIPEWEKEKVVALAREYPEKSCRELAFLMIDREKYFISESSVYRILKARGLITTPVFSIISAKDKFQDPPKRVNELWQTDFTYFKVVDWGWYYLSTVMDDYSRYIVAWKLCSGMKADDAKDTIDLAIERTGEKGVRIITPLRLLSDNGSSYIASSFQEYLEGLNIAHTRGRPYHPQTQGKIERYHRSMKNIILLDKYYTPEELEKMIGVWVEYYNNERYHEGIKNVTPADRYFGREERILKHRAVIKARTMKERKQQNCA